MEVCLQKLFFYKLLFERQDCGVIDSAINFATAISVQSSNIGKVFYGTILNQLTVQNMQKQELQKKRMVLAHFLNDLCMLIIMSVCPSICYFIFLNRPSTVSFYLFTLLSNTYFTEKTVGVNGIRTQIDGVGIRRTRDYHHHGPSLTLFTLLYFGVTGRASNRVFLVFLKKLNLRSMCS